MDVRKAFDSVNIDVLIQKFELLFLNDIENEAIKNILINFIRLYKLITINVHSHTINPSTGVGQGLTLSPIFFNIYINDTLTNFPFDQSEINIQAYTDNIVLQSNSINSLKNALSYLHSELANIGLLIN